MSLPSLPTITGLQERFNKLVNDTPIGSGVVIKGNIGSAPVTSRSTPQSVQEGPSFSGAVGELAKLILRSGPRIVASRALDTFNMPSLTPQTKPEKFLFGEEPIEAYSKSIALAPKRGQEKFGLPETTSKIISPVVVAGLAALDAMPFGGTRKGIIEALKETKTVLQAASVLKKAGVADDLIEAYAPAFAKATDRKIISEGVDALESVMNKTKSAGKVRPIEDWQPVFHGGSKIKEIDFNESNYSKTFFVSDKPKYASSHGGKGFSLNEMYLNPDAKLIDIKNATPEQINEIKNAIQKEIDKPALYGESFSFHPYTTNDVIEGAIRGKSHFAENPELVKIYKSLGYDGMISYEQIGAKNIGVWSEGIVKTKSELAEIINKNDLVNNADKIKGVNESIDPLLIISSGISDSAKTAKGKISPLLRDLPEDISTKIVAKYGQTVASNIVDIGGPDLAVHALINGNEAEIGRVLNMDNVQLASQKALDLIKEIEPLRRQVDLMQSMERASRAGTAEAVLEKGTGKQAFISAKSTLKGELPHPEIPEFKTKITPEETDTLFNAIRTSDLQPYQKITAGDGLGKLLNDPFFEGKIVTNNEIDLLQQVFGANFGKAVRDLRPTSEKTLEWISNILNVPRAIMSSMDMSAPFRQGLMLMAERPKEFASSFKQMFKYFFNERYFNAAMNDIASSPLASLRNASGLELTDATGKSFFLNNKEEGFMTNLAEKIPGIGVVVKASERAFSGFLNKLRADTFDMVAKEYMAAGMTPGNNPEVFMGLARFVNTATGRGDLPGKLKIATPLLNSVFFSPRFIASRVQMFNPQFYMSLPPPVRKMAVRSFLKLIGTGTAILSIAKLAGGDDVQVEDDPRSSDFGKIRIGNARWDVWGGYQQWVVLASRMISGQSKAASTGQIRDLSENKWPYNNSRLDTAYRFTEGRLAPVPSLVFDLMRGQTAIGEPITISGEAMNKLVPLYIQDITETIKEDNAKLTVGVGIPSFFGVGTQVFQDNSPARSGFPKLPQLPKLPKLPKIR
jgi:hypothetical protein